MNSCEQLVIFIQGTKYVPVSCGASWQSFGKKFRSKMCDLLRFRVLTRWPVPIMTTWEEFFGRRNGRYGADSRLKVSFDP